MMDRIPPSSTARYCHRCCIGKFTNAHDPLEADGLLFSK
jgi:hypothetical protein